MSVAESSDVRATEVNRAAGWAFSNSLKIRTATTPQYTLTGGDQRLVEFNATGATGTLFLPAQPDDWMEFQVCEAAGNATAFAVDGNGKTINGSTQFIFNAANRCRTFRYVPATGAAAAEWKIVQGVN